MNPAAKRASNPRQQVLEAYFAALGEVPDGNAWNRLREIEDEYLQSLQPVALSRCPFLDTPLAVSLDTTGLDGLWWYYDRPVRPADLAPPTCFAFTGAMKLSGTPEQTPFTCRPGPEAPFVLPLLLPHPDILAVISQVQVGPHTGYPVVYYSPNPPAVERFNDWGSSSYTFADDNGWHTGWMDEDESAIELDFDLEPWVTSEKLLWIAPGDPELGLQAGVEGCPYLGLSGSQEWSTVRGGKILNR